MFFNGAGLMWMLIDLSLTGMLRGSVALMPISQMKTCLHPQTCQYPQRQKSYMDIHGCVKQLVLGGQLIVPRLILEMS